MTIIDLGLGGADEPASVAEAKAWARIDRDDEDGLIAALIRAARETIEAMAGLVLVQRSFRLALDPVSADGWMEIARRPLGAITGVTAYASGGVPVMFDAGEAIIERALGVEAIRVSPGVRAAAVNGVEVEFEAGFAAGAVPENLRTALLVIVAASYEMRAAVDPGQQPAVMPELARSLIAPYRRVRI